jgi:hypothetical protein
LSQIEALRLVVDHFSNTLKTKVFIIEKFLDTLLLWPIRFRQKVLTDLPPLELFSLKEKAAALPGGLFVWKQFAVLGFPLSLLGSQL